MSISSRRSLPVIVLEGAVVEDVAVLEDLDERRALVRVGARKTSIMCLRSRSWVRATKLASAPSATAQRVERRIDEPNGVDLVTLPTSEVGEYWPLVRP